MAPSSAHAIDADLIEPLDVAPAGSVHHGIADGRVAVAGQEALVGHGELAITSLPARLVAREVGILDALREVGVQPFLAVQCVGQERVEVEGSGCAARALDVASDGDVGSANEALNGQRCGDGHVQHELKHIPVGVPGGGGRRGSET